MSASAGTRTGEGSPPEGEGPWEGRVICGDNVAVMARMPQGIVDLTVTSPPYDDIRKYDGYRFDVRAVGEGLLRVTRPGGMVVWVVADQVRDDNRSLTSLRQAIAFQEMGWKVLDLIIYEKDSTPWPRPRAYRSTHELMFCFLKPGGERTFNPLLTPNRHAGRVTQSYDRRGARESPVRRDNHRVGDARPRSNVWRYSVGGGRVTPDRFAHEHPAIFPEPLARDHILSWSNPGDLIFDPMCGSGTTLKMAAVHGRRYLGIDISAEYCDLSRKRVRMWEGQLDFTGGGAVPPAPA